MELGNRMVTSGGNGAGENLKEEAISTHCGNLSPKPDLIKQYNLDSPSLGPPVIGPLVLSPS